MTGLRTSVMMQKEDVFGQKPKVDKYEWPGTGLKFSYNYRNGYRTHNGIGSKTAETATVGRFGGSWSMNLILDYNNHNWMKMVFDTVDTSVTNTEKWTVTNSGSTGSYTFKIRKLNRAVGGKSVNNQTIYLLGCTCNSYNMSYESGSNSAVTVSLSGSYVDELQVYDTDNNTTDYPSSAVYSPVEWGCVNVDDVSVANTEKASIRVSMGKGTVPECGSRIDTAYYEGIYDISGSTTVYSNDPKKWYEKVYGIVTPDTIQPNRKSVAPLEKVVIKSQDGDAKHKCNLNLKTVWLDSWGTNYNPSSEITEEIAWKISNMEIEFITVPETKTGSA